MPDKKITELTETTTVENSDMLVLVDDPGGSAVTKKCTVGNMKKYQQVVTVAKAGGDYSTIGAATTAITDAASDKRYCISLKSGTYSEAVTLKNYIDLIGEDTNACIITQADATALVIPSNCTVENVTISVTAPSIARDVVQITNGAAKVEYVIMNNCEVAVTGSTASTLIDVGASAQDIDNIWIKNCKVYSNTANQNQGIIFGSGAYQKTNIYLINTMVLSTYDGLAFANAGTSKTNTFYVFGGRYDGNHHCFGNWAAGGTGGTSCTSTLNFYNVTFVGNTFETYNAATSTVTYNLYNCVLPSMGCDSSYGTETYNLYNCVVEGLPVNTAGNTQSYHLIDRLLDLHSADMKLLIPLALTAPASGATEADHSGNANTGTYQGTVTGKKRWHASIVPWIYFEYNNSTQYMTFADSDTLSFGNGSNDSAVSFCFVWDNQTRSGIATLFSKWDETTGSEKREYKIYKDAAHKIGIACYDESANKECSRLMDSVLSIGNHFIVITKDATGGATAMANTKIYIDGAVVASTATEDANYVAMENLTCAPYLGCSLSTAGARENYIKDSASLAMIIGKELSATEVANLYRVMKSYYSI